MLNGDSFQTFFHLYDLKVSALSYLKSMTIRTNLWRISNCAGCTAQMWVGTITNRSMGIQLLSRHFFLHAETTKRKELGSRNTFGNSLLDFTLFHTKGCQGARILLDVSKFLVAKYAQKNNFFFSFHVGTFHCRIVRDTHTEAMDLVWKVICSFALVLMLSSGTNIWHSLQSFLLDWNMIFFLGILWGFKWCRSFFIVEAENIFWVGIALGFEIQAPVSGTSDIFGLSGSHL